MFRGPWACTWAGFMWEPPFQLIMGSSIGPSSVGHMLSTSGKCVTKNSMRYVWYGALRIEPCNDFQNIVFFVLTTHLFNQQTKYTTDCTLKTAAAATRAGGATEAVSRPEEWRRNSLFQTKHQPLLQKGYQRTSVCIKLNKDPTIPRVRI